jgi:hypothetical protein
MEVVRIGEEGYHSGVTHQTHSSSSKASQPMSEELVLRGLRAVVDANKYPLLLVDLYGKHRIGVLVGCLRKLQRWNLTSVGAYSASCVLWGRLSPLGVSQTTRGVCARCVAR